ncbi:MAG TPA: hypothetical protein VFF16_04050 [Telluria sp.]|nr:hypothetical protein [Telluria sp.]
MKAHVSACLMLALLLAACHRDGASDGVRQTRFPGQVTAGGGTSGEVLASSSKKATDSSYAGGTPFHGGGMGGNVGGAKMGGTVTESGHGPSGDTKPPAAKTTPTGQ